MTVSRANTNAATDTADREIVITRVFDAPRDLVFEAFIDPVHIGSWWGPRGFTTTTHHMDVRPGGVWRHTMHGPDGVDYPGENVYVEIAKPERLVYDRIDEPRFRTTIAFADENGKTRLTLRMVFPTGAERDATVKKHGALEGGKQMLERLEVRLAHRDLVKTRILDAPRALVFEAWTDPQRLRRWWCPERFTNSVCELDARPGGAIRIHMHGPDGTVYRMTGVVREIVPPERLVFICTPLDATGAPLFETLNTVTFEEWNGKTRLTLRASVTMTTEKAPCYLSGMEQGWAQSLDRLAGEVAT
jgi:uncharacterized protein YndB with AHSA1/START domain